MRMSGTRAARPAFVVCGIVVCVTLGAAPARAQSSLIANKEFLEAAGTVDSMDYLKRGCEAQGGDPAAAAAYTRWAQANRADAIRAGIAQIRRTPQDGARLDRAFETLHGNIDGTGMPPCRGLQIYATSESAQIAQRLPGAYASLGAAAPPAPVTAMKSQLAPTRTSATASMGASTGASAVANAAQVLGFGLKTEYRSGYGGMLLTEFVPVALLKNGDAVGDVKAFADPGGLVAHKRANPDEWGRWRRGGAGYEFNIGGEWKKFFGDRMWTTMPAGFKLDGFYRRVGGAGNLSIGGTSAVVTSSSYTFAGDGTVTRDSMAGASASSGGSSVTTSGRSGGRGRYTIEGFILTMQFDDGVQQRRVLFASPQDPGIIWIDGDSFTRPSKR